MRVLKSMAKIVRLILNHFEALQIEKSVRQQLISVLPYFSRAIAWKTSAKLRRLSITAHNHIFTNAHADVLFHSTHSPFWHLHIHPLHKRQYSDEEEKNIYIVWTQRYLPHNSGRNKKKLWYDKNEWAIIFWLK